MEIWEKVRLGRRDYPYYVSDQGRVKNLKGRLLKPCLRGQKKGTYRCVRPYYGHGRLTRIDVHRLVALHFVSNPEWKREVNHLNGDAFDNRAVNLEWCTRSENERHKRFLELCRQVEAS